MTRRLGVLFWFGLSLVLQFARVLDAGRRRGQEPYAARIGEQPEIVSLVVGLISQLGCVKLAPAPPPSQYPTSIRERSGSPLRVGGSPIDPISGE